MNTLTYGALKGSSLPSQLNLCPEDPRFGTRVNRALEWLLTCGSFMGTTRFAQFCIDEHCFVTPGCVANVEAVRGCHTASRIENNWYRMLPGFNPHRWETNDLWFEYRDQVPSFRSLCRDRILRTFIASSTDRGKKIKFIGYDKNRIWVRTLQSGVYKDGEVVILNTPFTDTVTEFSNVTAVVKDETDQAVRVFAYPAGDDTTLTPFGVYEYWETSPSYQRYQINNQDVLEAATCPGGTVVQAEVKLAFIPVRHDDDILPIWNRVAMEMAVMGVKALDDGDLARSDALLYGDGRNQRLGAVPLLNQEIRTMTGDRFAANVRVGGPCGFRTIMRGFI